MFRLIIVLLVALYFVYIVTVMLHISKIVAITKRKITLLRVLCPFYYWIAPVDEKITKSKIFLKD